VLTPAPAPRAVAALPDFLTPRQIADALQVHERTVLRWAAEDASMPVTRLGGVVRFERAALNRWLLRKTRGARAGAQDGAQTASAAHSAAQAPSQAA
jgi:excisionase family DNA binding protein